jgi:NAD(P)-dependent dehydrogenase (short-subunit alcohol dehydrogenase family)
MKRRRTIMKLKPVADQVVVIVGCTSGIGRVTAREFAERGATLVLGAREPADLESLANELRASGARVETHEVDVASFDSVEALAGFAETTLGRVDTWVQLAAISLYATFEATRPEEFRRVIEVNLIGQAYGAMAALPRLRRTGGGALIEVSSVEAEVALPYQSAYAASKHGMAGFLRALRMELQAEDAPISVTQVMPSGIDTPLFHNARTKIGVAPKPTAPIYDPIVVARAIVAASEKPVGDLFIGGGGMAFAMLRRWLPGTSERVLKLIGFSGQRTDRPKNALAPDNLDAPIATTDGERGGFPGRSWSVATWAQLHPAAARTAIAGLLGAVALAARARATR